MSSLGSAFLWLAVSLAGIDIEWPAYKADGLDPLVVERLSDAVARAKRQLDTSPDTAADTLGALGALFHAHDQLAAAESYYHYAIQLNPANGRWAYLRGVLAQQRGESKLAIERLTVALAAQPDYHPAAIRIASLWRDFGEFGHAQRVISTMPAGDKAPAYLLAALGEHKLAIEDYRGAIEALTQAVTLRPEANRLHFLLGRAYRGIGQKAEAELHLKQAGAIGLAAQDPYLQSMIDLNNSEVTLLATGQRAFQAGAYGDAATAYRQALQANPDSIRARINLAAALAQSNQIEQAMGLLREVLAKRPENTAAMYNLARLEVASGSVDTGSIYYQRLLDAKPDDYQAALEFAKVLASNGNLDQALNMAKRAGAGEGLHESSILLQVQLFLSGSQSELAINLLETELANDPNNTRYLVTLANITSTAKEGLRDPEKALTLALAANNHWESVATTEAVALAYASSNQCSEAARWLEKALSLAIQPAEVARLDRLLKNTQGRTQCEPR
ncbi:MAG: tetratricopeptide repeat protein [Lysobacterales bacterium]